MEDRIPAMAVSVSMLGELELIASSKALAHLIFVLNTDKQNDAKVRKKPQHLFSSRVSERTLGSIPVHLNNQQQGSVGGNTAQDVETNASISK